MKKFYTIFQGSRSLLCFLLIFLAAIFGAQPARAQVPGNSLTYNGVDQFTTLPNDLVLNVTGSFTIEAWIFYRGGPPNFPRIMDLGWDTNHWIALVPAVPDPGNPPRFGMLNNTFQYVDGSQALTINAWHHLAVTLDAATNTLKLYVDGVLDGTNTNFTHRLSDIGNTTNDWLGKSEFPTDPYFNGIIDEFRISKTVRYTGNFTPPTTPFSLDANTVAYYRFEEGTGQTSADASGNFASAILGGSAANTNNDPTWTSPLPVHLTSFSAVSGIKGVQVGWTASLDAPSYFEVQRSIDGSVFSTVATIREENVFGTQKTFGFTDAQPLEGKSYYRLKYTEIGGPVGYSKTVAVNFTSPNSILVYPKPVRSGLMNIHLSKPVSGPVEMRVVNISGAIIYSQKTVASNGTDFQLSTRGMMAKGAYVVEFIANGTRYSEVVIAE